MSDLYYGERESFDFDSDSSSFAVADYSDETTDHIGDRGNFWESYFSDDGLPGFDGLELDDLDESQGHSSTSGLDKELVQTLFGDLPQPHRKKKKDVISGRVTEEDYDEGPERMAFLLVRDRARACYHKVSRAYDQSTSLRWIFSASMDDEISLDLACSILEARPDAVRVRVQMEFFERMACFEEKLPGFLHPVPFFIKSAAQFHAPFYGEQVVTAIWEKPSIRTEELLEFAPVDTLHVLSEKGIIAQQLDRWYILGRGFF
jgi:hypothetical protein